jgi:hypothetical protein
MKKGIFIGIGAFILLSLAAIWGYLLLFGTPNSTQDVFANLGFSGSEERPTPEVVEPLPDTSNPVVNVARPPLRQLTLRPVAGFFVPDDVLSTYIRYVERGTGYIYEINLGTGEETQVTSLTVPQTVQAFFAPDGSSVALTNYESDIQNTVILQLQQTGSGFEITNSVPLPPFADNLSYQSTSTILYTLTSNEGTIGYSYNLNTQLRKELFSVPLTQITTVWGNGVVDTYFYPKPTRHLPGSVYWLKNNEPTRLTLSEKGFMFLANNTNRLATALFDKKTFSTKTLHGGVSPTQFAYPLLPEKCAFYDAMSESMWCGASPESADADFLEDWYQGSLNADDDLWLINISTGEMSLLSDMQTESGRQIDIASIKSAPAGLSVFFTNKIDSTLWMYDTVAALNIN